MYPLPGVTVLSFYISVAAAYAPYPPPRRGGDWRRQSRQPTSTELAEIVVCCMKDSRFGKVSIMICFGPHASTAPLDACRSTSHRPPHVYTYVGCGTHLTCHIIACAVWPRLHDRSWASGRPDGTMDGTWRVASRLGSSALPQWCVGPGQMGSLCVWRVWGMRCRVGSRERAARGASGPCRGISPQETHGRSDIKRRY